MLALKSLTFTLFVGSIQEKVTKRSYPFLVWTFQNFDLLEKIHEEAKSCNQTCQPNTIEGFAYDITIIHPTMPAPICAFSLDLWLKPKKMCNFFLTEYWQKVHSHTLAWFHLKYLPWKFLKHLLGFFATCSGKASAKEKHCFLLSGTLLADPFGGIQIWILKIYLAQFHYLLLIIDLISENFLASIQCKFTKHIKR